METLFLELCTELGICLWPEQRVGLERMPTDDVDAFTRAVPAATASSSRMNATYCATLVGWSRGISSEYGEGTRRRRAPRETGRSGDGSSADTGIG